MTATGILVEYHVTFGQKYRREPHPTFPKAHPDGWVTVWAHDEDKARQITVKRLGRAWAFLYGPDTWEPSWYPLGNLATWRPS